MKKADRLQALNLVKTKDLKVVRSWWNPFQNVQWQVLKSRVNLTEEQYRYLTNNRLVELKEEIEQGKIAILKISQNGLDKINQLTHPTPPLGVYR